MMRREANQGADTRICGSLERAIEFLQHLMNLQMPDRFAPLG
jgi:hypothetical protein